MKVLDKIFFSKIAPNVIACYRKHIFGTSGGKGAKDIDGKNYPKYSPEYEEAKKSGTIPRQSFEFKDSRAPALSSDLLRSMNGSKINSNGFGFGSIVRQGRVKHLAKLGRIITKDNKPLPDKCSKMIIKKAEDYVQDKFDKIKGGIFNI